MRRVNMIMRSKRREEARGERKKEGSTWREYKKRECKGRGSKIRGRIKKRIRRRSNRRESKGRENKRRGSKSKKKRILSNIMKRKE